MNPLRIVKHDRLCCWYVNPDFPFTPYNVIFDTDRKAYNAVERAYKTALTSEGFTKLHYLANAKLFTDPVKPKRHELITVLSNPFYVVPHFFSVIDGDVYTTVIPLEDFLVTCLNQPRDTTDDVIKEVQNKLAVTAQSQHAKIVEEYLDLPSQFVWYFKNPELLYTCDADYRKF